MNKSFMFNPALQLAIFCFGFEKKNVRAVHYL